MFKLLELLRSSWDSIFNKNNKKGEFTAHINEFTKQSTTNQIAEVEKLIEGKTIKDDKKLENIGYVVNELTKKNKSSRSEYEEKLIKTTKDGLIKKIIDPQLKEFVAKAQVLTSNVSEKFQNVNTQRQLENESIENRASKTIENRPFKTIETMLKEPDRYEADFYYYYGVYRRGRELRQIENGQTVLHAEVQETMVQETMRRPRQGENETEQEFKTRVTNYEREMEYAKENYKILNNDIQNQEVNNLTSKVEGEFIKDINEMTKAIQQSKEEKFDLMQSFHSSFRYKQDLVPLSLPIKYFYIYAKTQQEYLRNVQEKYQIRSDAAQANTNVTNSNINVTNSNTKATNSNTNVTKINCAIEEQVEMLNIMNLLTLIGIVVIGVFFIMLLMVLRYWVKKIK